MWDGRDPSGVCHISEDVSGTISTLNFKQPLRTIQNFSTLLYSSMSHLVERNDQAPGLQPSQKDAAAAEAGCGDCHMRGELDALLVALLVSDFRQPSTFHIVYIVTASGTVLLSRRKKCSPDIKVDRKRNVEVNGDGHDCKRLKVAADATALRPPAHIDEESDVTVTNPLFIALHSPMDVEPNSSPDTLCSTPKKDDLGVSFPEFDLWSRP